MLLLLFCIQGYVTLLFRELFKDMSLQLYPRELFEDIYSSIIIPRSYLRIYGSNYSPGSYARIYIYFKSHSSIQEHPLTPYLVIHFYYYIISYKYATIHTVICREYTCKSGNPISQTKAQAKVHAFLYCCPDCPSCPANVIQWAGKLGQSSAAIKKCKCTCSFLTKHSRLTTRHKTKITGTIVSTRS